MFCKYCGKKVEDDARFCQSCGERLDESAPNKENTIRSSGAVQTVTGTLQPYLAHWKSYMIIVFTLWAVSVFPLFSDWISFDLFGYYEKTLSIFGINKYHQEQLDAMNDLNSYDPYEDYSEEEEEPPHDENYYDFYYNGLYDTSDEVDSNDDHHQSNAPVVDEEIESFLNLINAYIIVFCTAFIILLAASIYFMKQDSRFVFGSSIALSSALILFPLITVLFIKESLQNDFLAAEVFSFTSAPYILIILNIVAIAFTFISKKKYDATPIMDRVTWPWNSGLH